MSCRPILDKDGKIVGMNTAQGIRSKLFDKLNEQFGKEDALMYFAVSESDDFQEIFTPKNKNEEQIKDKIKWNPSRGNQVLEGTPTFQGNIDIERIKNLDIKGNEDGATFNLDGSTFDKGGLIIPIISLNTTQQELSKELIEDFIQENSSKIGDNSIKVGIYKFEDSDKISIDLNIAVSPKFNDLALTFGKYAGQESLFNLDTFENVKTGADGKNPKNFTDNEFRDIANSLSEGKLPNFLSLSPQNSTNYANLTEDSEGNFVFYHVGQKGFETIKKGTGQNIATSKEEASAMNKVGGLAMYYPSENVGESVVSGESKYIVKVSKDKVYDFNADELNLLDEAEKEFKKAYPNQAFDTNTQLAFVTKVANEKGFDAVVARWKDTTRVQTTKELTPVDNQELDGNTIKKDFKKENKLESNKDKGWKTIAPQKKEAVLTDVYNKIVASIGNDYSNPLYKLGQMAYYSVGDNFAPFKTQEEITKVIQDSNLPQEMKKDYFEALATPDRAGYSVQEVEPTVEEVLRYITSQNRTEEKLTKEQLVDLQDFSSFDRQKLFDAFYDNSGIFSVSESKLTKSGLYSAYEAGMIANDMQLQERIKDSLERLKNTSEEELNLIENVGERSKINEFNSFGKLVTIEVVNEGINQNNEGVNIKIENKEKDILDEFDDEVVGKRTVQNYEFNFTNGSRAFGTIEDNIATITQINAPKQEGNIVRGQNTYYNVLKELKKLGVNSVKIRLQSKDSRIAIQKMVDNGNLTNPREYAGISVDEYPTLFDIRVKDVTVKEAEVFVQVDEDGISVIRPKRNTETELILTITAKETENSKVSDLNNLPLNILQNNEEETRQVLNEIENELIKDSINVIGLMDKPIDQTLKDFIAVLDRFIKDPTVANSSEFATMSDEYFQRDLSPKKENVEGESSKEYVKLETTLSEEEVYNQQGLIKLDDTTYIKTAKENLEDLYENVRTYTEKYSKDKTLEEHVQEQLKDYSYTNAETAEAIILYKMYFGVDSLVGEDIKEVTISKTDSSNPSFSDMQTLTIDGGKMEIGLINGRDIYSILELKVDEDKRRQGRAEKLIKKALFYTNGKISGQASNDASVSLNYKLGMRAYNKGDNTELSLEETKIQRANSAGESVRMLLPLNQKSVTPTKQVSNFTGDYKYLTENFPSDFYSKFLAEYKASAQKKNSKLFRNFYSNFEINEKGIKIVKTDAISLRNIKIYADENLKQYSLISRQMPDLIEAEQSISNPRVEAINNPQKVKESKENLFKLNDQEIILRNETEDFVKIGNDIYESVAKQGNLNHYVKLEKNKSDYYAVEVKAPQTNLNISDYNYLNETPEKFKSIKDFLKGKNPDELSC